jgi:hypothetical protein
MKIKNLGHATRTGRASGAVYERPKLRVFGPVGKLTQAGSGVDSELMFNGPPDMQMCQASMSPNQIDAMC